MQVCSKYISTEQQELLEMVYNNGKEFDKNNLFNYTNKRSLDNVINELIKKGLLEEKAILTKEGIKYKYLLTFNSIFFVEVLIKRCSHWFNK